MRCAGARSPSNDGLGSNTIIWALTSFLTTPGTLLAGTQSNGGYALTFEPAINAAPADVSGTAQVGKIVTANPGTWSGTETIEYEYQWQRCTNAPPVAAWTSTDATSTTYTIPDRRLGALRVQVTGKNDVPTFGLNEVSSATLGPATAKAGTLPGDNQSSTASIVVLAPGDTTLPQAGDTLHAQNWKFNPAPIPHERSSGTATAAPRHGCVPIPGAHRAGLHGLRRGGDDAPVRDGDRHQRRRARPRSTAAASRTRSSRATRPT